MKTKAEIYKDLKEAIILLYKEENRTLDPNDEGHNEIVARYKERIAILEEILEVNE